MLRTLGIPARVVNGFRGGEFNSVTGSYIVRGRDAHSWVEAYFPRYGWITFDPTPAGAAASDGTWSRAGLYVDALREFWREWVINYDFAHQMSLSNDMAVHSRRWFDGARLWMRQRYAALLERARQVEAQAERSPRRTGRDGAGRDCAGDAAAESRRAAANSAGTASGAQPAKRTTSRRQHLVRTHAPLAWPPRLAQAARAHTQGVRGDHWRCKAPRAGGGLHRSLRARQIRQFG